jgi:biopolymer transport protein ExbD
MAEIDMSTGSNRCRRILRPVKKLSTKVDLTPMVDLGFLLITFFMVTTAWTKPRALGLNMAAKGDSSEISEPAVLTVLLGKNDKLFYYNGSLDESLKKGSRGLTGYQAHNGIRELILQKQMYMDRNYPGGRKEMMVLIKASADASYANVVHLLDEMLINKVGRYAIVDINEQEKNLLEKN